MNVPPYVIPSEAPPLASLALGGRNLTRRRAPVVKLCSTTRRAHIAVRSFVALWLLGMTIGGIFFLAPTPTHADHGGVHIVPTPGETCADDECREQICPQSPVSRICVEGKCVVKGPPRGSAATENLPCNSTLDDLVIAGINLSKFIFGITGSLMLLFIVYGGYQYLTSLGNPEAIQTAKKTLTAAFVGFILIISATIFIRWIAGLILPGPGEPGAQIPEGLPEGALPKIKLR